MAKGKWDEDSEDSTPPSSPPPARRGKFDDEEGDSDVVESWDAEDDSEAEREKAKKAEAAAAKTAATTKANHKSKTQRLEAHQAERTRRKEEAGEEESSDEEEGDKRSRLRKTEQDSDLRHAEDLFDDVGTSGTRGVSRQINVADPNDPANLIDLSKLVIFDPKTKNQFTKLRDTVSPLIASNTTKPHYVVFLQELTKELCKDLKSDEIKKVSSGLTTLANEKMKEEKAADKGGKKTKAQKTKIGLNAARDTSARADTATYDEMADDDFM